MHKKMAAFGPDSLEHYHQSRQLAPGRCERRARASDPEPLQQKALNPFRAPEPLPILNPSNFVPKNGFPVVKGLKRAPPVALVYDTTTAKQHMQLAVLIGSAGRPGGVSGYTRARYRLVS